MFVQIFGFNPADSCKLSVGIVAILLVSLGGRYGKVRHLEGIGVAGTSVDEEILAEGTAAVGTYAIILRR